MTKAIAKTVSFLFHPLLILTYSLVLLILVDPYAFGANDIYNPKSKILILRIFLSTFFIPFLSILMLYFLGMVRTLNLEDKMDRTGPYIITGIFYLWLFRNFWDSSIIPPLYATFMLGATVALFLAFLINIFSKISIHTVGIAALISMIVLTMVFIQNNAFVVLIPFIGVFQISVLNLLLGVIIIAGVLGTCRYYLQNYEPNELYGGYMVGFLAPFIALQIMVAFGKIQLPIL
ncbi:MAG: hypothetical protein Sapg2KO_33450 [Saprospiraceae bacterium]